LINPATNFRTVDIVAICPKNTISAICISFGRMWNEERWNVFPCDLFLRCNLKCFFYIWSNYFLR